MSSRHFPMIETIEPPGGFRRFREGPVSRAFTLFLASAFLAASMPPTGLEGGARKLDDAELSEMRGKFIAPSGISYFGLALQSSWQSADGLTTIATVHFNMNFASGSLASATPQLLVGWTRSCAECGDPSMDLSTPNGVNTVVPEGLNSVSGVVQTQIINGTDNSVRNAMTIAVLQPGQALPGTPPGLTQITSSRSQEFSDGDVVQFILEPGQIALAMREANGSLVRQSVGSEMKQAAQHVLLNGNFNSVTNGMGITVGLSELAQSDRLQVESALSAMKGHGF